MSTHLICPICNKDFTCDGPHEGEKNIIETVLPCPLMKGAIYVFVKNDEGVGIKGIKTLCNTQSPDSDGDGFAFFEQLESKGYETKIDLSASGSLKDLYYSDSRITLTPTVQKGRITLVEFMLRRYGNLQVEVKRQDDSEVLPKFKIKIDGDGAPSDAVSQDGKKYNYEKLKPTVGYSITLTLEDDGPKNFEVLEENPRTDVRTKPGGSVNALFELKSKYWVEFAVIVDGTMTKGTLTAKQKDQEVKEAELKTDEPGHIPNLVAGKIDVQRVDVDESCEFAGIS